jgi:hypothetical protein
MEYACGWRFRGHVEPRGLGQRVPPAYQNLLVEQVLDLGTTAACSDQLDGQFSGQCVTFVMVDGGKK